MYIHDSLLFTQLNSHAAFLTKATDPQPDTQVQERHVIHWCTVTCCQLNSLTAWFHSHLESHIAQSPSLTLKCNKHMANLSTKHLFVNTVRVCVRLDSLLDSHVRSHIAKASVMASALNGSHDVIHQAHAVLGPSIKGAHLPVVEACPRAGDGMPCLPQTDLQECVPTCKPAWLCT